LNVEQTGSHRAARFYSQNACALWVEYAGNHGLRISNANGNGVYIQSAAGNGVHVNNAGGWAGYFDGTGYFADYVGLGTSSPQERLDVAGNIMTIGFRMPTGASDGYVLTSDGSGLGTWQEAAGGNSNWTVADSVLFTNNYIGVARGEADNFLFGDSAHTMVNLGVVCTTGMWSEHSRYSTISGGWHNIAERNYTTIGGGESNRISSHYGTIGGGKNNSTIHEFATVAGGENNRAHWQHTFVGGGKDNVAGDWYSVVAGGLADTAIGQYNTISGGENNLTNGLHSSIGGGNGNTASANYTTVSGGINNSAGANSSTIAGGMSNSTSGDYAAVSGGYDNSASGNSSAIVGGQHNSANAYFCFIGGGVSNTVNNDNGVIGGGQNNEASGNYSFIGGGQMNKTEAYFATIPGGLGDTIGPSGDYSMVFGRKVYINNSYRVALYSGADPGRVGINRDDHDTLSIDYPLHVGTLPTNGNGAYLTNGGVWTNGSSRAFKENGRPFDKTDLLSKISNLNVESWNFIDSDERHIGPYAEEFVDAFNVGAIRESDGLREDHYLAAGDVAGVALAGVKELIEIVNVLREENKELKSRIEELEIKTR
jgi:hypothetical protein